EAAVRDAPSFSLQAHLALGAAYYFTGRAEEALMQYELVLRHQPNNFQAQYYRAHLHLSLGNFEQGWADYDRRAAADAGEHRAFPYPRWKGEPLEEKAVLIYSEQGLGDEIMFASCFPEVMRRARLV